MRILKEINLFKGLYSSYSLAIERQLKASIRIAMSVSDSSLSKRREALKAIGKLNTDVSIAKIIVDSINKKHKKIFKSRIDAVGLSISNIVVDEGISDYLQDKIEENVALITKVDSEVRNRLIGAINRSITDDTVNLLEEIEKVSSITGFRSRMIASNEISKIQAQLHSKRASNLGIEEYEWVTSRDEKVRKTHKNNDKKIFRLDTAPDITGHPAMDIACRCTAKSIINLEAILQGTTTTKALKKYAKNRSNPSKKVIAVLKAATLPADKPIKVYLPSLNIKDDGDDSVSSSSVVSSFDKSNSFDSKTIYIITIKKGARIIKADKYPAKGIKKGEIILPNGFKGKVEKRWEKKGFTYIKVQVQK